MKRLVFDLDNTICSTEKGDYVNSIPNLELIKKMREYREDGYEIVIASSRNMRTYEGNVGKINANTLPIIINWLEKHSVPYDEIYMGKPWCGFEGFYIDDRSIRPREFETMNYDEILLLIERDSK
jgi:capsule biosynthesis phosphatase